jgi:hypothetical protein
LLLPLSLAKWRHQVFVGITEDVVVIRPVAREVEFRILEDRDQAGEPFHKLLAIT